MALPMRHPDLRLTPPDPDWAALAERLRRLALALTRDQHRADDLCQQTLAALLAKAPDRADHAGYARRTLVRLWMDDQRSIRRRLARLVRLSRTAPSHADPRDPAADAEHLALVRDAIDHLPPRQRAALTMRLVEDLDYDQIAAALGCTPAAVRSSLHLARRAIRTQLGEEP